MSDFVWAEVRAQAVRLFRGDHPHPETEQDVLDVFKRDPRRVVEAIEHVGRQVGRGGVNSGWAVLRAHLQRGEACVADVVVSDDAERGKRVAQAESWLRHAGMHFASEAEVVDELFGDRGRLRAWAGDELLRERLLDLWRELRPLGEQVEREALERAEQYNRARAEVGS
jgi:hypothetical protein